MIIFYWKGKVWWAFLDLCSYLGKSCILMDDQDRNDSILSEAETIVPTPWISQLHDVYTLFGNKILSELDFLRQILQEEKINVYTIGITGTDGKSTVTRIIAQALKQLLPDHTIHIPWNFDEPMSQTILHILQNRSKNNNIFVTECSSFMLYPTKVFHFDIGIWTNFATDHLNWHPTMDEYFKAKQRIVELANHAYITQNIYDTLSQGLQAKAEVYATNYDLSKTHFVGKHNEKNMALALQVVQKSCDEILWNNIMRVEQIQNALQTIYPLEHRLQPIKTTEGVTWYDDGKSTSAQSLGAALEAFAEPIIAICGGSDKGDGFDHLKDAFAHTAYWVFLWQTAPQFADLFTQWWKPYTIVYSMEECVAKAREAAKWNSAKVVLFSPGCASFGMFKDYKDRAQQFLAEVEKI